VQVKCEDNAGCAVTEDGRLFCYDVQRLGSGCRADFQEVPDVADATSVSMSMDEICVLHRDGTVSCAKLGWAPSGESQRGEFGTVPGLGGVVQLRSSRIATCGLLQSGELRCWGLSGCGSLGISEGCEFTEVSTPISVQHGLETRLFGMQDGLTCSLDANDDVWCWGLSGWDGEAKGSPVPRRIVF
jgi:alpha-tubulin suppressor-like RCC1 family protein